MEEVDDDVEVMEEDLLGVGVPDADGVPVPDDVDETEFD